MNNILKTCALSAVAFTGVCSASDALPSYTPPNSSYEVKTLMQFSESTSPSCNVSGLISGLVFDYTHSKPGSLYYSANALLGNTHISLTPRFALDSNKVSFNALSLGVEGAGGWTFNFSETTGVSVFSGIGTAYLRSKFFDNYTFNWFVGASTVYPLIEQVTTGINFRIGHVIGTTNKNAFGRTSGFSKLKDAWCYSLAFPLRWTQNNSYGYFVELSPKVYSPDVTLAHCNLGVDFSFGYKF